MSEVKWVLLAPRLDEQLDEQATVQKWDSMMVAGLEWGQSAKAWVQQLD
jgi:hypothetical protein